jgi:hypothetical protein
MGPRTSSSLTTCRKNFFKGFEEAFFTSSACLLKKVNLAENPYAEHGAKCGKIWEEIYCQLPVL